jgi:hypothetical protein
MIIIEHSTPKDPQAVAHNDDSDLHKDELGENTGEDTGLAKAYKEDQEKNKNTSIKPKGPGKENL